jgi:hypothetical protein
MRDQDTNIESAACASAHSLRHGHDTRFTASQERMSTMEGPGHCRHIANIRYKGSLRKPFAYIQLCSFSPLVSLEVFLSMSERNKGKAKRATLEHKELNDAIKPALEALTSIRNRDDQAITADDWIEWAESLMNWMMEHDLVGDPTPELEIEYQRNLDLFMNAALKGVPIQPQNSYTSTNDSDSQDTFYPESSQQVTASDSSS